jgi:hypothetical protein
MKYALMLLPLLATTASAQDDVWKLLAKGDRVQITFRSGNMILGVLDSKPADPRLKPEAIDYSTVSEITLDVSLEYPGLNGTMTVAKKEIKDIRKIQNMDAATMKRIREEMQRIQAQAASDEASRQASERERDKSASAARAAAIKAESEGKVDKDKAAQLLKEFQDLQKGKELLQRFPPDKWGPKTIQEIAEKNLRKQPITLEEREFLSEDVQRLWNLALKAQNEAKATEAKDKEKEKEKEEKKQ